MSNERALADELARQADRLHTGGPGLDDVLGRATTIRRRRRVAAGIVAAAMVGAIAPGALWASDSLRSGGQRTPGFVDTPSQSAEPTPTPATPSDGGLDLASLPRGAAPAIPYLEGGTVHLPDGSTREIGTAGDFLAVGDAVVRLDGDRVTFDRPGSEADESFPATTHPVGNASRDIVAWGTESGLATWTEAEGVRTLTDQLPGISDLVSVQGNGTCQEQAPEGGGCIIHYHTADGPAFLTSHGVQEDLTEFLKVNDVGGDLVAGLTEVSGDGSCSRVVREGYVETCEYSLLGFSGDPGVLAATDAYLSGHGFTSLTFLDTDLEPIQHWDVRSVTDVRWEDAEHLLASVYDQDDKAWYMVRFGADGEVELAAGPLPGDDALFPWSFEGQATF